MRKMGVGTQGMAALRGSYGGLLMFGMLGRMAGLAMANPATIIIGLFMGRSALKGEKERQLAMRRGQARQAAPQVHRRGQLRGRQGLPRHAAPRPAPAARLLRRPGRGAAPLDHRGAGRRPAGGEVRRRHPARSACATSTPSSSASASCATRPTPSPPTCGRARPARERRRDRVHLDDAARQRPRPARRRRRSRTPPTPAAGQRLQAVLDRLDEPLRVAIAGKVKAGKSTLLNALVGEELAPTDAGECTRIVTWYRDGITYRATLRAHAGRAPPGAVHPRRRRHRRRPRRHRPPTTSTASSSSGRRRRCGR